MKGCWIDLGTTVVERNKVYSIIDILVLSKLTKSRSEAKRKVEESAVYHNGERVDLNFRIVYL